MEFVSGSAEPPTQDQLARWARRANPPENEVPAAVALSALLGRAESVAVMLAGVQVYSTGVRLDVAVRARGRRDGLDLFEAVGGHHGGADRLLFGVEYADGRVTTNAVQGVWPPEELPDHSPSLQTGGGGGGGRSVDVTFFLSPVPPAGPMTIVCAWPARGIRETRTVLDGSLLAAAARQVRVLWPAEPEEPWRRDPPPPPDVPDGGWFARVLRPDR